MLFTFIFNAIKFNKISKSFMVRIIDVKYDYTKATSKKA